MKEQYPRLYDTMFRAHLAENRQMLFASGPRQVGKTTTCRGLGDIYLSWDDEDHRELILSGPAALAAHADLNSAQAQPRVLVLDELHKFARWKRLLKGFFDVYEERCRIIVTGSSRLNVYRRGGDSLMGRYFPYRMHPLSVGELLRQACPGELMHPPAQLKQEDWRALWEHGGFPEPLSKRNERFTRRWRDLRREQLFKEDLRDLTRVRELGELESLGLLLASRSGDRIVYSNLAREVRVAENTIRSWLNTFCSLHYGFLVRPWFHNVTKALRKEPKWFLRDWSGIEDAGQRAETFVACHLLKAVEAWTDLGLGEFELCYVRDKQKREVDLVVIRNAKPWFLAEVKTGDSNLTPSLVHFQKETGAEHAFQVVIDREYIDVDCFQYRDPVIVPARTLLSQLV